LTLTKMRKTTTKPFAGGEDNGYFIRESAALQGGGAGSIPAMSATLM
jgi:hypothetical protein